MKKGYYWSSEYDGYGGTTFERHYHLMYTNGYDNMMIGKVIWKRIWGMYKADINGQIKNFKTLSEAKNFVETVAGAKGTRKKKETNEFGLELNLR